MLKLVTAAVFTAALLIQLNVRSSDCSRFEQAWLAENEHAETSGEYELDASEYAAYIGHGMECAGGL